MAQMPLISTGAISTGAISTDAVVPDIESLAIWARMLTPAISIAAPNVLLLEIAGSLKLFGGLGPIKHALIAQLKKRAFSARISVAPTAHAAVWLSRHTTVEIHEQSALQPALRALPLQVTGWPAKMLASLADMGIKRIGDMLRLPRNGLARRIGVRYLRDLDRALGIEFDVPAPMEWPESLRWQTDLPAETEDQGLLLEAAELLVEKMSVVLRKKQKQIRSFRFVLCHLHREPSVVAFELIEQDHDKRRVLDLLVHRLDKLCLPAPVVALELHTGELQPLLDQAEGLFTDDPDVSATASTKTTAYYALIERVRERFGPKSVHGVALAADHRPELAWLPCRQTIPARGKAKSKTGSRANDISPWGGERPLWLLNMPIKCDTHDLRIEKGVERIESGWWDQQRISRDYYKAQRHSGEWLWVYFDNLSKAWYLHGVFG